MIRRLLLAATLVALAGPARGDEVLYRLVLGGGMGALATVDPGANPVTGTVRYDGTAAEALRLSGYGGAADGPFEWWETLAARDGTEKATGVFAGALADGGRRGTGEWRSADGTKTMPLILERAGHIATLVAKHVDAKVAYAAFDLPRLASLNERQATDARRQLGDAEQALLTERKARDGDPERDRPAALSSSATMAVENDGPDVVSLLRTVYAFTGGAHGTLGLATENYAVAPDGAVRSFGLWDALEREPGSIGRLSALLLGDLRRQDATEVTRGAIKDFRERLERDDIPITAPVAGLAFHFAPYEVGPWVQGSFRVLIPNAELVTFIRADGPLAQRAAKVKQTPRRENRW